MRRLTAAVAVACLAASPVGVAAGPAAAQPGPTEPPATGEPTVPEPVPGEAACAIADTRLVELSGLVATEDGYVVVNDGTEFLDRQGIFFLDQACQVVDQIGYPSPPRDPEAMELDRAANVLWVADTGDNFETTQQEPRPTVAFWRIELGGDRTPVIYRFTYPDGPRDAEALLLTGDGTPVIVTKTVGTAELFVPAGELRPSSGPDDALPLERVGEFTPPDTGTAHPLGLAARQAVTGAANAPDGSAVVLRTYTDAFEFDVTDGDVVGAITNGEPRITPLPDEPLGEAISYSADGERFLTVSEVPPESLEFTPVILGYTPAAPPPQPSPANQDGAAQEPAGEGGGGLFNSVQDIINVIAAIGVVGLLLVAAGVFGIVRARRRATPGGATPADGGPPVDRPATGRARPAGMATPPEGEPGRWESEQAGAAAAGVYTSRAARPAGTEYRGTEYRGTEYGGGEYGGTEYGGQGGYDAGGPAGAEYDDGQAGTGYGGHAGTEYGDRRAGGSEYRGSEYRGTEYGGAGYDHAGGGYGAGGRTDQPFDQDWPEGYPAGQAAGQGYGDPGYRGAAPEGGAYQGGTYRSAAPDDYSEDPDYPYEFRQRDRW
jgi:hypothetical protein